MPEFNTFDLGRAYSQAQNIKESKQMMDYRAAQIAELGRPDELRNLQIEAVRIANKKAGEPKKYTYDEVVDSIKMLNLAASAIIDDPASAEEWVPRLQRAGELGPDVTPEIARANAKGVFDKTTKTLENIKKFDDDPKRSAYMQQFIERGGDPNDLPAVNKFFDAQERGEEESYGTGKENIVKIGERYFRLGSKGGRIPMPADYQPEQDAGSDSTAPESLMWRQVVAAYGGMYDPKNNEFLFTDPAAKVKAQRTMAQAARLLKDNPALTPSEAVDRALNNGAAPGASGGPTTRPTAGAGNAAPAKGGYAKEGDIVTNGKQRLKLQNGQWVPVP